MALVADVVVRELLRPAQGLHGLVVGGKQLLRLGLRLWLLRARHSVALTVGDWHHNVHAILGNRLR